VTHWFTCTCYNSKHKLICTYTGTCTCEAVSIAVIVSLCVLCNYRSYRFGLLIFCIALKSFFSYTLKRHIFSETRPYLLNNTLWPCFFHFFMFEKSGNFSWNGSNIFIKANFLEFISQLFRKTVRWNLIHKRAKPFSQIIWSYRATRCWLQ